MADEVFGTDEAEAILKRAAGRRSGAGSVSRERLMAMAEELDISPEDVEAAIAETQAEQEQVALRKQFIAGRRGTILPHLVPYISVNLFLFVIWFLTTPGGHPWFLYPLMGWGIGVASHVAAVWPTSGPAFEAEFASYLKKNARKEQTKTRRGSKRAEKSAASAEDVPDTEVSASATIYEARPTKEEKKNVLRAGR